MIVRIESICEYIISRMKKRVSVSINNLVSVSVKVKQIFELKSKLQTKNESIRWGSEILSEKCALKLRALSWMWNGKGEERYVNFH